MPGSGIRIGALVGLALAIFTFVVASAAARSQATITVCASGCTYTSLQTAIGHAAANDTIQVSAGTYTGQIGVVDTLAVATRTKSNLTIVGAGSGSDPTTSTIINASSSCPAPCSSNGYGFYVRNVSGITLKNFRLIGPTSSTGYGMKTDNDTNVVVDNVTVTGAYRSEIDMNGVAGATLTNINATGSQRGNGLALSDSTDVSVNGITTSGNAWAGIAMYAKGAYFPCGIARITIQNASIAETQAIYTGIDVNSSCTISNVSIPSDAFPYKVVLNGPEGGLGDPQDIWVKSLADATTVVGQPSTTPALLYSTADGSNWVTSGFTVQAAVNAAAANSTVHVLAGTYPEDVTVSKALTLSGAQAGVDARTRSGSESILKTLKITSGGVVVDGFTFNGDEPTAPQIGVLSSSGVLSGLIFRNDIFGNFGSGVALSTLAGGNVLIEQNLFNSPDSDGGEAIQIKADGSNAGGCTGTTVQNNTFAAATNNGGSDVNLSCTGSNSTNVTVSGNTSTGGSGGSSFTAFSGVNDGISITNNVATTDGSTVFFFGNVSGSATVSGNTLTSSTANSVSIHGGDVGTSDHPNTGTFTIQNNTLTASASGVTIAAGTLTGSAAIHGNDLSGAHVGVTNHSSTASVNASGNWWGAAAGPGTLSNVTVTPWCMQLACTDQSNAVSVTSLTLANASIGTFDPNTTSYSASVGNSVTSVTATATANTGATVSVSGGSSLAVGTNTITVTATSADRTASKTYTITVTRAAAPAVPQTTTTTATPPTTTTTTTTAAPVTTQAPTPNVAKSAAATPAEKGSVTVAVAPVTSTPSTGTTGGTKAPAAPVTVATSWQPTTFTTPVTVTVTPQPLQQTATGGTGTGGTGTGGGSTTPAPTPVAGGFAVGNTVVQVTITDDATGDAVTQFAAPLTVHLSALAPGEVPAYSHDGTSWTFIPQLQSPNLPDGQPDGYYVYSDGSVDIYTRHATLYGLLIDAQAPTAATPKVILQKTGVRLSWAGAKDNVKVDHYVISLNGHGFKSTKRTVLVLPLKAGTYVIRAVDAAGNKSAASRKVTITRTGNAKQPFAVHIG
jgi:hypothetical protein